uniref:Uncharacterized protein n=1 Tax=Siphoviridae sp. ctquf9 TaxID=2826470 RepID=A0A8S5M4I8_9CAUD|nr:MAG TPA: hypothetical protein [Siphoviridae sp. ctquf9]
MKYFNSLNWDMKFQKKFRSGIFVGIWYNRRDSSSTVKSEITR